MAASPLPAPEPLAMAPVDLLALAAANATNATNPEIVAGAATTANNVSDAANNAQAAAGYSQTANVVDRLNTQSPKVQAQLWGTFTASQRTQLTSAGYKPPAIHHSSFWGDIGNVVSAPWRDVGSPILHSSPVSGFFNAAGMPLRAVQHAYRAGSAMLTDANGQGLGWSDPVGALAAGPGHLSDTFHVNVSRVSSLHDWAQAWRTTTNGEAYLSPAYTREALKRWGPQVYTVAHALATGKTPNDLLAAVGNNPQAQQALVAQMQSPEVRQATAFLNAAHLSPGRAILGPDFISRHPTVGNAVSGAVDGAVDWWGDPLARAGVALKGASDARFVVQHPDDVQQLFDRYSQVRDAMSTIAEKIAAGHITTAGGLFDTFPKAQAAMEQLAAARADTTEKVLDYFKTTSAVTDLIKGSPSDLAGGGGILPHLTAPARVSLAAKGKLREVIDWAADRPTAHLDLSSGDFEPSTLNPTGTADRFVTGAGRLARRLTTLVPQNHVFVPTDPNSAHILADLASQFLPAQRVNDIVREYLADPDLGGKWRIYRSLMIQMGEAAGLHQDPDLWDSHIAKFVSSEGRFYSTRGNDVAMVDDQPVHVGVLKNHQSGGWLIPSFKELYTQGNKAGITNRLTNGINADWQDKFMNQWRPLVLAHLGFAPRVGGEEAGAFIMREGLGAYMRAVAANVAAKNALRLRDEQDIVDKGTPDLVDNQVAGSWNMLTSHLPASVTNAITDGRSLVKAYYGDLMDRSFRAVAAKMTKGRYEDAVGHLVDHGVLMPDDLTAMHGYDTDQIAGDLDGPRFIKIKHKGKLVTAEMKGSGDFQMYENRDPLFKQMWYRALHEIANDDWAREALPTWRPFAERVSNIADKLQSDPAWRQSILSVQNRAGAQLSAGEITERQLAESHARMIVSHVGSLIRSPSGKVIGGLVHPNAEMVANAEKASPSLATYLLRNGKPPSMAALDSVPRHLWPSEVQGPEIVPVAPYTDVVRRGTNKIFEHYIGPQINWISRQPMFIHHYTASRQAFERMADLWRTQGMDEAGIEQLVHDNSVERAIGQIMPFVHNPQLRSQMSTLTRNLAPFWFAQEQFYKRWARTLKYSPAAFRHAQLLSNGLRHSGFEQTDPTTGQTYFVYPGSHLVQEALTHTLFWLHGNLPINPDLIGQTNQLSPGLTRGLGGPSFGPLAVIPMNAIKAIDPNFTGAIEKVEGKQAGSQSFLQSFLPTTVYRAMQAAWPSGFAAQQYASAQMQAMQMLEATGHGISTPAITQVPSQNIPNPQVGDYVLQGGSGSAAYVYQPDGTWRLNSAADIQQLKTRVANWARIIFMTRLLFGFAAPASPEVQYNPGNLHGDLQAAMQKMPVDQALTLFLNEHPNATPYTVFQTQSSGGGFLPATDAAMNFLSDHSGLASNHQLSATYFIPPADTAGKFSTEAYQEQLADGLRQRKSPSAFYDEIVYQAAARLYYKAEDYKFQLLASHQMPSRTVNAEWTQWSERFLQANPIFADQMSSNGQLKRQQIMDDVGAAIRDRSAPEGPQTTALGELYNTYVTWVTATNTFGNPNQPAVSAQTKALVDEQYAQWLNGFIAENPGVKPLVDRAIRPDLTGALNSLASQGVSVNI